MAFKIDPNDLYEIVEVAYEGAIKTLQAHIDADVEDMPISLEELAQLRTLVALHSDPQVVAYARDLIDDVVKTGEVT